MQSAEWVAAVYFAYVAATGVSTRRLRAAVLAAGAEATVALVAAGAPPESTLRAWAPGVWLLFGYWLSGALFRAPRVGLEQALGRLDRRTFDAGAGRLVSTAPRVVLESFELAYLCCTPMIPAGLGALALAGRLDRADAFWTTVLVAGYGCYGLLPWLPTRPPRALEGPAAIDARRLAVRRANLWVLDRASIQVNTFPSAHASTALATALAVTELLPLAGAAFLVLALSIAVASVIGRYHYLADAVLGILVALAAWSLAPA